MKENAVFFYFDLNTWYNIKGVCVCVCVCARARMTDKVFLTKAVQKYKTENIKTLQELCS
jgi:hypothetical protein